MTATEATSTRQTTTLAVSAYGTLLVLAVYSSTAATIGATADDLHTGVGGLTWGVGGMSLGLATAFLTVGALADNVGRKRVLAYGAALLAVSNVIAALAPSTGVFIVARVLEGVAGAAVVAASLGSIGHAFHEGAARTRATAIWGAALGGGIALGPLMGALFADTSGWRSIYWLQALASLALVAAAATLEESRSSSPRRLDSAGALAFAASMACLNAGLVQGRSGWTSTETIMLLAAGALLLAAFGWIELRGRMPMLDLHLFREPLFVASISGALFTGLAVIGLLSFSPTLFQRGLGMSTLESAVVLGAWSVTSMVVAYAAPRLPARFRSHTRLSIGLAVIAAGELGLTGLGSRSTWAAVVPGLVVAGIGSGLANAALGRLAVESVPRDHAGMGSGANNTARYVGGAAGVALVVAVISATGAGPSDPHALVNGWNSAALVSAGLCAAGALVAGFCRPRA